VKTELQKAEMATTRRSLLLEMVAIGDGTHLDLTVVWEAVKVRVTASTESRHTVVIQKMDSPESL